MAKAWNLKETKKLDNGRKTYVYEVDGYTCEIDEIPDGFCVSEANFDYLDIDTRAKSRKTLLNRLDKLFVGY